MYSNIVAALAVATILVVLTVAYLAAVSSSQSYILCKIAKVTIQERGNMLYIASSRPTVIHIYLIYAGDSIRHVVCYGECQVAKAPLVVAVTPFDIAWRGDVAIIDKTLYLSPCGVTTYQPQCTPWIRLPDAKTSMPTRLPLCNCSYVPVLSGGVLGMCRIS